MLILLTGINQAGKDGFFQVLLEEQFYAEIVERLSFRDILSNITSVVYGIPQTLLEKNKTIKFYADNVYSGDDLVDSVAANMEKLPTGIPYISTSGFESPLSYIKRMVDKLDRSDASIKVIMDLTTRTEYETLKRYDPEAIVINIAAPTDPTKDYPYSCDHTLNPAVSNAVYRGAILNLIETAQLEHLIEYSKYQPKQRSPEWFNLRKGTFTASNCYLIRNPESKFFGKGLPQLVAEKKSNAQPKPINTRAIRHGVMFEDVAVAYFTKFLKPGTRHDDAALIFNSRYDKLAASPDGFISGDVKPALIEIKCPSRADITGIPKYYNDQMQLQMMVSRIPRCYYLAVKFIRARYLHNVPDNTPCGVVEYASIFSDDDGTIVREPHIIYSNKIRLSAAVKLSGFNGFFYVQDYFMDLVEADVKWQQTFLMRFSDMRVKYEI